jgi:hypothetical protein
MKLGDVIGRLIWPRIEVPAPNDGKSVFDLCVGEGAALWTAGVALAGVTTVRLNSPDPSHGGRTHAAVIAGAIVRTATVLRHVGTSTIESKTNQDRQVVRQQVSGSRNQFKVKQPMKHEMPMDRPIARTAVYQHLHQGRSLRMVK